MEMTIKSRKLGRTFTFSKRGNGYHYIYEGRPNNEKQICRGGGYMGDTLSASDEGFKAVCRRWYRNYIKQQN